MANNNNNIAVDLASEAAGLPASTAILPLFPSDANLVKREEFQAIRLALLRLVEREGAHVNASKYATILDILWGSGANSLSQRFAHQWEPKMEKRRIKERVMALVNHFSSFNSSEPSEVELIAKRLKTAMDDLKASNAARLEEERRKKKARQDSNLREESSLGALPVPGEGATAPSIRGATAANCHRNQANANLLPANPRSVNLHHVAALCSVSPPTDELLLVDGEESGGKEGFANEEDGDGGNYFYGAPGNDEDEVVELENGGVGDDAGDGLDPNDPLVVIPLVIAQPVGVLAGGGGDGGNGGGVVGGRGGGGQGGGGRGGGGRAVVACPWGRRRSWWSSCCCAWRRRTQ